MIFSGDIAMPYVNAVKIGKIPDHFYKKNWISNLEGALVDTSPALQKQFVVFNDKEAIKDLVKIFPYKGFMLANNHIFDTGSFKDTTSFLSDINIPYCGIGNDIDSSMRSLILEEDNVSIAILNLGWEVVQCKIANHGGSRVNPLTKENALTLLAENRKNNPYAKILFFMHWCYELEFHPQPMHRELAKMLIDNGADGIIGCHPHRIGGFEIYKNKPIIYSLGNWMFKQNYYKKGTVGFSDFCRKELVFEWNFSTDEMTFHFFEYNRDNSTLYFLCSHSIDSHSLIEYQFFSNTTNNEYKKIYRENHYHRKKGLPVYYWEDSDCTVFIKNTINKLRDLLVLSYKLMKKVYSFARNGRIDVNT
jgi:poly-gamma-glutamate synthesis protein (capsule biosynthesis protein)